MNKFRSNKTKSHSFNVYWYPRACLINGEINHQTTKHFGTLVVYKDSIKFVPFDVAFADSFDDLLNIHTYNNGNIILTKTSLESVVFQLEYIAHLNELKNALRTFCGNLKVEFQCETYKTKSGNSEGLEDYYAKNLDFEAQAQVEFDLMCSVRGDRTIQFDDLSYAGRGKLSFHANTVSFSPAFGQFQTFSPQPFWKAIFNNGLRFEAEETQCFFYIKNPKEFERAIHKLIIEDTDLMFVESAFKSTTFSEGYQVSDVIWYKNSESVGNKINKTSVGIRGFLSFYGDRVEFETFSSKDGKLSIKYSTDAYSGIKQNGLQLKDNGSSYAFVIKDPRELERIKFILAARTTNRPTTYLQAIIFLSSLKNSGEYKVTNLISAYFDYLETKDSNNQSSTDSREENNLSLNRVDSMTGQEFELYCANLLKANGFTSVELTPGTGDQGVDIVAIKDGVKYAVQCKCYSQPLGNKPIQEVYAGKSFYQCHVGAVMTNSSFTAGAKELAKTTSVLLWDREKLINMAGCVEEIQQDDSDKTQNDEHALIARAKDFVFECSSHNEKPSWFFQYERSFIEQFCSIVFEAIKNSGAPIPCTTLGRKLFDEKTLAWACAMERAGGDLKAQIGFAVTFQETMLKESGADIYDDSNPKEESKNFSIFTEEEIPDWWDEQCQQGIGCLQECITLSEKPLWYLSDRKAGETFCVTVRQLISLDEFELPISASGVSRFDELSLNFARAVERFGASRKIQLQFAMAIHKGILTGQGIQAYEMS